MSFAAAAGEGAPPSAAAAPPAPPTGTHSQSLIGKPATEVRTAPAAAAASAAAAAAAVEELEAGPTELESAAGSKIRPKGLVASDPSAGQRASWIVAGVVPGPPGGWERGPVAYHPTGSSEGKVCLSVVN